MKIVPPNIFHQFSRKNYEGLFLKRNSKQQFALEFCTQFCINFGMDTYFYAIQALSYIKTFLQNQPLPWDVQRNLNLTQHTNSTTKRFILTFRISHFYLSISYSSSYVYCSILSVNQCTYVKEKLILKIYRQEENTYFQVSKHHHFSKRSGRKEDRVRVAYAYPPLSYTSYCFKNKRPPWNYSEGSNNILI